MPRSLKRHVSATNRTGQTFFENMSKMPKLFRQHSFQNLLKKFCILPQKLQQTYFVWSVWKIVHLLSIHNSLSGQSTKLSLGSVHNRLRNSQLHCGTPIRKTQLWQSVLMAIKDVTAPVFLLSSMLQTIKTGNCKKPTFTTALKIA